MDHPFLLFLSESLLSVVDCGALAAAGLEVHEESFYGEPWSGGGSSGSSTTSVILMKGDPRLLTGSVSNK